MISRDPSTTDRSRRRRIRIVAALWACGGVLVIAGPAPLDGDELPVSVEVKSLAAPETSTEPEPQPMTMSTTAVTLPTLPGGKLPQYHLGSGQSVEDVPALRDDPRLRLMLMLSAEPILLEAEITVDGKPFRSVREQRIEEILTAIRVDEQRDPPATEVVAPEDVAPDAAGAEVILPEGSPKPVGVESDKSAEEPESLDAPVQPAVAEYVAAVSAEEIVRRYVRTSGDEISPEEIRWLLANWIDGPVLLMLRPNFQRFRAEERPAFDLLDQDQDGTLSSDEMERAALSFQECDRNGDDIVDALEIARAAARLRDESGPSHEVSRRRGGLVLPVPVSEFSSVQEQQFLAIAGDQEPNAEGDASVSSALHRFDVDANGRLEPQELQALHETEPDVRLTIAFRTAEPSDAALAVTAVRDGLGGAEAVMATASATVTLSLHGVPVEFSAVQAGASDQVSVGAVADGYPLLPLLDPNDDGRLTIRELRELVDRLRRLDRDDDGHLGADEVRAPVRVCIGLGPVVHRELAGIRSIDRPQATDPVTGPDWFVRMDRNSDLDLTRSEFPGTDEQFLQLDADSDGLISAQEALDFDQQSPPPEPPPAEPQAQRDEPS